MKGKILKIIAIVLGGAVLLSSVLVFGYVRLGQADYEKILNQIYNYEMHISSFNFEQIEAEAKEAFDTIGADGAFADIDYTADDQTNWKPASHLAKLRKLVVSYINPNGAFYKSHDAYEKITAGLKLWQDKDPRSTNWYMQEISSPQNVGAMLVMMRFGDEKVPEDLEKAMLKRMKEIGGKPKNWTGANKVDISVHYIYRGALNEDFRAIKTAVKQAFSTLTYTTAEGFQYDGSYQQHGSQLYITGYGEAIVSALASIITAVDGSQYAITPEQLEPLTNFINTAYIRVIRGQYRLYNTGGRSMSRENDLDISGNTMLFEKMKCIDSANAEKYDAVIARITGKEPADYMLENENTHFYRSDYTLHTGKNYTFDVRTVSNRTCRNENGNKENLKGYFMADGAYSITVKGDEYFNIFPVWDYAMIPGTTVPYVKDIPLPPEWGQPGQSNFAGGISDGRTGVSAYAYTDNDYSLGAKANKSYFMLGDVIVCLGSAISTTSNNEMRTTLNQCLSDGDVYTILNDGTISLINDEHTELDSNVKGIYHGGVGYLFYDDNEKVLTNKEQSGKWTDINSSQSNTELITEKVFTLYESHGTKPSSGSYQYVLLPGIDSAEQVSEFDKNSVQILSNTEAVQAVKSTDSNIIYAVFFKAGELSFDGNIITVDQPCIIMADGNNVLVSSPDQNIEKVNVKVDMKTAIYNVEVVLPKNEYAGSTDILKQE